jgi:sn-glycerol 3-phosphate transport system permease protein
MGSYIKNSVLVTAGVIVLQLIIMVPTAYAFAKYKFYAQEFLFGAVLLAFMIPVQVTFIPIYLLMSKWGMINSLWPQILPFGANAFGIFLLRQGFKQIPDEIIESAKMDSAGEWKVMWRVMVPMAKSSMITIALFSFIATWNSYFWPLVITTSDAFRPLTIAIERIKSNEQGMQWNSIMAGNVLLVIPVIIIYLFASKKIIQAFTYNGVK